MPREYYEESYHYEQDAQGIDKRRFERFLGCLTARPGARYLDIGCGVGWTLSWAKTVGLQAFGIDFSYRALKLGHERVDRKHLFVQGDGMSLPFDDESFELISALGVVEHFPSPERGIAEIARVCRKGGEAVLVVPNSMGILGKARVYAGTEQPDEFRFSCQEWRAMIDRAGMSVVNIRKDYGPRILKDYQPLKILVRSLLKSTVFLPYYFTYQFIFCCRKDFC